MGSELSCLPTVKQHPIINLNESARAPSIHAVRLVPRFQPIRATIAAVLFLGWVVATNHCTLGLTMGGAARQEHQHCPGHPHSDLPGNDGNHGSPLACCKAIQAPPLADKICVDFLAQFAAVDFFV